MHCRARKKDNGMQLANGQLENAEEEGHEGRGGEEEGEEGAVGLQS